MSTALPISPGDYSIGSDEVPNASPKHRRRFREEFWIDATPLSWAHYEVFVAAGGYRRDELWPDPGEGHFAGLRPRSVDERCRVLIERSGVFRGSLDSPLGRSREAPITGVSWFEAVAICRFYGARLPFEVEWEVAMQGPGKTASDAKDGCWWPYPASQWGCRVLIGSMQEWTADAFMPRYWRSDFQRRGVLWSPEAGKFGITVRGASPSDVHQHVSFRTGRDPLEANPYRGFRRVWDSEPSQRDIDAVWRCGVAGHV